MTGIHPLSLNFWVNEASGEIVLYTSENLAPQNIGIATEIASTSVSVARLLLIPVWDTVSFYFRFVPDSVFRSQTVSTPM